MKKETNRKACVFPVLNLKMNPNQERRKDKADGGLSSAACSHPFSWSTGGVQGVTIVGCFLLVVYPGGGVGGPGGLGQGGALVIVSEPLLQRKRGSISS